MFPAKRVSRSKNRALSAAGTWLALLSVIVAGPVTLGVAVLSKPAALAAPPSAKPAVMRTAPARATDPSGYAQLFVHAWLRSSADDATSAQARLAQSMAPNVDLSQPATDAQSTPEAMMTPRSAQTGGGSWVVTVAAQYAAGQVRYYTVPVAADRTGTSFTVTGAPGVVAGPARAAETTSPYTVSVPGGRLLAPSVHLTAVSPAPYQTITVPQISAAEEAAATDRVPADGTRVRIYVTVKARDSSGRWPLAYEIPSRPAPDGGEIAALQTGTVQEGRLQRTRMHSLMRARQLNDLGNSWINMLKKWVTMPCRPWWQSIPLVGTLARQVPMGAAVLEDLEERGSTGDTWCRAPTTVRGHGPNGDGAPGLHSRMSQLCNCPTNPLRFTLANLYFTTAHAQRDLQSLPESVETGDTA